MALSGYGRWFAPLLAGSALLPPALAAQPLNPPTREELVRGRPPLTQPRAPSRLTVEGGPERAPCPLSDPQYAGINVNFASAEFAGLKGLASDDLRPAWEGMAGRDVPLSSLCEIRDAAATMLRRAGYLAAVQVPPQRIEKGGTVRFDVLMAKLVAIQVRGDAGRNERLIAAQLEAIRDEPVFNMNEAERHLLLARDLPGYDVRLVLRPANAGPGEVIGEVRVTRQPMEVDANIQNWGSRETGRWGGLARVQFNGLTGLGDATSLSIFNTVEPSEQTVLQAGHSFFIGHDGLRLSGDFTYAWTKPDLGPTLPIHSRTLIGTLAASYPIIRRQAQNLLAAAGFDLIDQRVDFGTSVRTPISRDRLRILFARLDYDRVDADSLVSTMGYSAAEPRWRLGGSIELRHGISILDASKAGEAMSRAEADPTAFVLRGSAYGEFRPAPGVAFSLSPRAQYSAHPLASYEEMAAGNYTFGRGYDPGTLTGDSGVGLQAELRYGSIIPKGVNAVAFQPYLFIDSGWIWNRDSLNIYPRPDPQTLHSLGGGIRGAWGNHARIDLMLAVPMEHAGVAGRKGDPRLLLSLTTRLVPWRP